MPQTWATTTGAVSPAAAPAGTSLGAVPEVSGSGPGGLLGGLPLTGTAGRAATGVVPDARFLERPPMLPPWSTVI
nr:hypothetical protein [Mycobacterium sp. SP-6446]